VSLKSLTALEPKSSLNRHDESKGSRSIPLHFADLHNLDSDGIRDSFEQRFAVTSRTGTDACPVPPIVIYLDSDLSYHLGYPLLRLRRSGPCSITTLTTRQGRIKVFKA